MATDARTRPDPGTADSGAVLLITLLLVVVLTALGTASTLLVSVETVSASNHRDRFDVANAAEGLVDSAIQELALLPDWTPALTGAAVSRLQGALILPPSGGGTVVNLEAMTAALQQESYGGLGWGGDTPHWRVFGHGVPGAGSPLDGFASHIFGIIWLSDDVAESDGNPGADSNGVLVVRARAIGLRQSQADAQAVIGRVAPGITRRVSSRLVP